MNEQLERTWTEASGRCACRLPMCLPPFATALCGYRSVSTIWPCLSMIVTNQLVVLVCSCSYTLLRTTPLPVDPRDPRSLPHRQVATGPFHGDCLGLRHTVHCCTAKGCGAPELLNWYTLAAAAAAAAPHRSQEVVRRRLLGRHAPSVLRRRLKHLRIVRKPRQTLWHAARLCRQHRRSWTQSFPALSAGKVQHRHQ
jgi:hypothetical protein